MTEPRRTNDVNVEDRVRRANLWLHRARQDYRGAQRMMPKSNRKVALPNDPALVIWLLQQSIEKAVKALFVASGEDEDQMRRVFGHASLSAYLAFLRKIGNIPLSRSAMETFFAIPGFSKTPLPDLESLAEDLQSKSGMRGDATFRNEWASCPVETIHSICEVFGRMRTAFTVSINNSFQSTNVAFDISAIVHGIDNESITRVSEQVLGAPLDEHQIEALSSLLGLIGSHLSPEIRDLALGHPPIALTRKQRNDLRVTLRTTFYAVWGEISLLMLAALTFPHAIWTRYPSPHSASSDPVEAAKNGDLGSDLYRSPLGIVEALPSVVKLASLTLESLGPAIESTAFCSLLFAHSGSEYLESHIGEIS